MKNHVAAMMKSPNDCSWPKFSSDMLTEYGKLGTKKKCYLTWIDATNSYGGRLHIAVRIKLKDGLNYSGFALKEPQTFSFINYK